MTLGDTYPKYGETAKPADWRGPKEYGGGRQTFRAIFRAHIHTKGIREGIAWKSTPT